MPSRETTLKLQNAKAALRIAEFGLEDVLKGLPDRQIAGLSNVSVYGRAVTNALQRLRNIEPDFDSWYAPYQNEMKNDPLMEYVYKMRSTILKEVEFQVAGKGNIKNFQSDRDFPRIGSPPPFAKGFFMLDSYGGSGWEVALPDGTKEKYYVRLPSDVGTSSLHFKDAPKSHLGKPISDDKIETLCSLYLAYIRKMVADAEKQFGVK